MPGSRRIFFGLLAALTLLLSGALRAANDDAHAEVQVKGAGWWRDRELRVALERLLESREKTTLDANAIEDGAVILSSSLGEQGFQRPRIQIVLTLPDGDERRHVFDSTFTNPLPRPLNARKVRFDVDPGVRYHIDEVTFSGLVALREEQARRFFKTETALIGGRRINAYSPSRITRAVDALLGELKQRGYAEAEVQAAQTVDEATGDVDVSVTVREGPRWRVADFRYQQDEGDPVTLPNPTGWIGQPWSATLHGDIREAIRQTYYAAGHPDVGVHVEADPDPVANGERSATVIATTVPGVRATVGQVRFEGNATTRESVLRRRVRLEAGDPLNPVVLERARYRISRLGVFESVDLRYEPEEGSERDPVFTVREGARYETSLLMGYGSYEQLRAGVEHRQMNILGLAHQSRLELIQSMKSTSGTYVYTVPELFGESLDGTGRLFGLQRQEIAFLLQEFGVNLSVKRAIRAIRGDASAGYTFEVSRNRNSTLSTQATDDRQINVARINFGLTSDRRDNPLRPRHGYSWSAHTEMAHPRFGGQATYQRLELAGAYHTRWGEGRWVHLGLTHGVATTYAAGGRPLPVNKRFYPGGDNSIRGYQRGEAAPRGADGLFIGAKSYLLGNVELEQALAPNWSAVIFADALGTAVTLSDYPFQEKLYTVGLGIRYQTLIGPLRLEYGRNIHRRPGDPSGTWHFSIGYPF